MAKTVQFQAELTEYQALQFAQFLKRVRLDHYQELSPTVEDAYEMQAAGEIIRDALAEAGFAPR